MPDASYCAEHPETQTGLRCGRCNKPICPRCMVETPVGYRCRQCGEGPRLPTYDIPASFLVRAAAAALAIGIGGGVALVLARVLVHDLLYVAAMGGYGYLLSRGISAATNHKRGRAMQITAAGGVLVALSVVVFMTTFISLFDLLGAGVAIYVAYVRLR